MRDNLPDAYRDLSVCVLHTNSPIMKPTAMSSGTPILLAVSGSLSPLHK